MKVDSALREAKLTRAESFAKSLDKPMGILGLLFLFVVLGQLVATQEALVTALTILGWVFWLVFVGDFLLRAYVARFQLKFWKRNWWQVIFLLVPFLRFFRSLQALRLFRLSRVGRLGATVSASVRGTRSAGRLMTSRIAWLVAITAVVALGSSQLLYATGAYDSYSDALFEAALTTVTGSGITSTEGFPRVLHITLASYSVAVFATLAGTLGAFFLRGTDSESEPRISTR
ncbi:MAG: ion transporter [Salinibacterium sp.]|nr:ion transporter [Salinibacterium sp.]